MIKLKKHTTSSGEVLLYNGEPDFNMLEELSRGAGDLWHSALDQGFEPNPNLGEEEQSEEAKEADALSWLQDQTQVIEFEGGVIIASF